MKQSSESNTSRNSAEQPLTGNTVKILADSIYQTLKAEGCESKDIIGVSSQLISLVTDNLVE